MGKLGGLALTALLTASFQNCTFKSAVSDFDSQPPALDGPADEGGADNPTAPLSPPFRFKNFITVSEGRFRDGTEPFRFVGATEGLLMRTYVLLGGGDRAKAYVKSILATHKKAGSRVVRIWADPTYDAESVMLYFMQASDLASLRELTESAQKDNWAAYNQAVEARFQALDYILWSIEQAGMRAILVLNQPWPAVVGESGYAVQALRHCREDGAHRLNLSYLFFSDPGCIQSYLEIVSRVFSRANHLKGGLLYKDDPTIFSWELMNETSNFAENEYANPSVVRDWISWVSLSVKKYIAPKQMLGVSLYAQDLPDYKGLYPRTGSGTYNHLFKLSSPFTSAAEIAAIPTIDYLDVHIYTGDPVGIWADVSAYTGADMILDLKGIASSQRKPLVVSEFGVSHKNYVSSSPDRDARDAAVIRDLNPFFYRSFCGGVDGLMPWQIFPEGSEFGADSPYWTEWINTWLIAPERGMNVLFISDSELARGNSSPAGFFRAWAQAFTSPSQYESVCQ